MFIETEKNRALELPVPMLNAASPATFKTGLSVSDEAYYLDSGGSWSSLAIADTFAEIGTTGVYQISLTAGEMNHDYIMIKMSASGGADNLVLIRTEAAGSVWKALQRLVEVGATTRTFDVNTGVKTTRNADDDADRYTITPSEDAEAGTITQTVEEA